MAADRVADGSLPPVNTMQLLALLGKPHTQSHTHRHSRIDAACDTLFVSSQTLFLLLSSLPAPLPLPPPPQVDEDSERTSRPIEMGLRSRLDCASENHRFSSAKSTAAASFFSRRKSLTASRDRRHLCDVCSRRRWRHRLCSCCCCAMTQWPAVIVEHGSVRLGGRKYTRLPGDDDDDHRSPFGRLQLLAHTEPEAIHRLRQFLTDGAVGAFSLLV